MAKESYFNQLGGIKTSVDIATSEISSIRTLINEVNKKSNFSPLSYKILLDLVAVKLVTIESTLYSISFIADPAEDDGPTIDNDPEVTEDDLAFT